MKEKMRTIDLQLRVIKNLKKDIAVLKQENQELKAALGFFRGIKNGT